MAVDVFWFSAQACGLKHGNKTGLELPQSWVSLNMIRSKTLSWHCVNAVIF